MFKDYIHVDNFLSFMYKIYMHNENCSYRVQLKLHNEKTNRYLKLS